MKKTIIAATCLTLALFGAPAIVNGADWVAPIQTTITNVVTETVTKVETKEVVITPSLVRLDSIIINNSPSGNTTISVRWSWLDENNKIVNHGIKRFTQEQISAKLESNGSSFDAIKNLFVVLAAEDAVLPDPVTTTTTVTP